MKKRTTRTMVYTALFIAMVFVAANIRIYLPLGTGGLIHLGTLMGFTIALKFGKRYGALSGAIGMAILDIASEWAVWAPGTFVVRLVSGYLVGWIAHSSKGQGEDKMRNYLAIAVGGLVIIVGYYLFEAIFLTGFGPAFFSIPGNLAQIAIGTASLFILKSIPQLNEETFQG